MRKRSQGTTSANLLENTRRGKPPIYPYRYSSKIGTVIILNAYNYCVYDAIHSDVIDNGAVFVTSKILNFVYVTS